MLCPSVPCSGVPTFETFTPYKYDNPYKNTTLHYSYHTHRLAEALNYLHNDWCNNVHIIHRDLKPDNIGWSSDGVLKLFDFGLSVSVRAQRERTEQYR